MASTVSPDPASVALYPHFPSLNPVLFSRRDLLTPDLPEPFLPHGWHTCCPQCLEQTSVALTSQQLANSYSSFISPFKSHFRDAFLIPLPYMGAFKALLLFLQIMNDNYAATHRSTRLVAVSPSNLQAQ